MRSREHAARHGGADQEATEHGVQADDVGKPRGKREQHERGREHRRCSGAGRLHARAPQAGRAAQTAAARGRSAPPTSTTPPTIAMHGDARTGAQAREHHGDARTRRSASPMAAADSDSVAISDPLEAALVDDAREHRKRGDGDGGAEEQRGIEPRDVRREQSGHAHADMACRRWRRGTARRCRRSTPPPRSARCARKSSLRKSETDEEHVQRRCRAARRRTARPSIRAETGSACMSGGAAAPNNEGPSTTPAIISPITCGWRSHRRTSQPHKRQVARITNICRKKIIAVADHRTAAKRWYQRNFPIPTPSALAPAVLLHEVAHAPAARSPPAPPARDTSPCSP